MKTSVHRSFLRIAGLSALMLGDGLGASGTVRGAQPGPESSRPGRADGDRPSWVEEWLPPAWLETDGTGLYEDFPPDTDDGGHRGWWAAFGDARIDELVSRALSANRDLRQMAHRLELAMAEARIAGAEAWPQVDFGWNSIRQQQNFVGLPIPGSDGRVLTTRFNSHAVNLNVSWELDLWGRIRSGKKAARRDVEAADAEYQAACLSLTGSVVKAWWRAVEAGRQLELARGSARNDQERVERVDARYEEGVRDLLDLRLARSQAATTRAQVAQRERELRLAVRQLEVLLGGYPTGTLDIAPDLPEPLGEVPAGLPAELLGRRPDLRAAEIRIRAEEARWKQARAALLPRISLTAGGGRTSADVEDLLSNNFNVWSLAGNLAQPVFQGGRLRAGVARARARWAEVTEQYVGTVLQALAEVENGLTGELWLREHEKALREATLEASEALRLAERRYDAGLEPYLTLLESQRRAWDTESQWLVARRMRLENRVDLHLALGGGLRGPVQEAGRVRMDLSGEERGR
jgi:multidrug efflux system outer membrane protein